MASLCLNSNLAVTSTTGAASASPAGGYVMPDQIGSSAIPFYYLPAGYPTTIAPNANMPPELIYSSMLGYHHSHPAHHLQHHHHVPQTMGTAPSAQIIMIPGIGSTNVNSFNGFKPTVSGAASGASNAVANPIDSYVKFNPYATFPTMQNNTSHSSLASSRLPVRTRTTSFFEETFAQLDTNRSNLLFADQCEQRIQASAITAIANSTPAKPKRAYNLYHSQMF
jgi:hypothetical protein